jgi:hypothetical protein
MANPHNGEIKNFSQLAATLEDGALNTDLSAQITDIVNTLNDHVLSFGGAPSASLKLKIDFKLKGGVMQISASNDITLPKSPRSQSIMWTDANGQLCQQNPRQRDMFSDVNAGETRAV